VLLTAVTVTVGIWTLGVRPFDAVRVDPGGSSILADPNGRPVVESAREFAVLCTGPFAPPNPQFWAVSLPIDGSTGSPTDPCTEHRERDQRLLGAALLLTWVAAAVGFVRLSRSRRPDLPRWTAPTAILSLAWLGVLLVAVPAVVPVMGPSYESSSSSCQVPLFQRNDSATRAMVPSVACFDARADRLRQVGIGEGVVLLVALVALTAQADVRDARARRAGTEQEPVGVG
jgi:hypothetical protein